MFGEDEKHQVWRFKADNITRAWAHFDARDTVLSTMPFRASIELTQNCNFKCIMCAQSWEERFRSYHPEYNMDMEVFVSIAEQLFPTCVNVDLRGFGETTILPYWPEVVHALQRYPYIEWNLVSNLSLARDDIWDLMMRTNFVLGGSVDGCSKETLETIRVGANFERTLHNLGVLRDARRKYGNGWMYFISVVQKRNLHELRGIIELARAHDVMEVQFHTIRGFEETTLGIDGKLQRAVAEAIDCAIELGVTATFNVPSLVRGQDPDKVKRVSTLPERAMPLLDFHGAPWSARMAGYVRRLADGYRVSVHQKCFKPFCYANIDYRGHMGTCNHMQHPSMPLMGDLHTQTIAEVWNSPAYQDFRAELLGARPRDERCQWCFGHRLTD